VRIVEASRFAAAQPGGCQEADQGGHAGCQQWRGQGDAPAHELGDVFLCVQVGDAARGPAGDQPGRNQLGGNRIQGVDVSRKRPNGL